MYKVVVFTSENVSLEDWRPWLEQDFDVSFISNEESLFLLIRTWRPHIIIYSDKKIKTDFIKTTFEVFNSIQHGFGLIIVAPQYDLREEQLAFQLAADHFILTSSPLQSVHARVMGLVKKVDLSRKNAPLADLISLPQKIETVLYKDLVLFADQNIIKHKGQLIHVTPTQFKLLLAFLTHLDEVLSRDWLLTHVFKNANISLRSIDANIAKLKRALPILNTEIVNIYGRGYMLRSPKSQAS